MAGNKRGVYPTSGKRRRSYYEFSRDYPGTRYAKNKKSSTSEALDTQKRIKMILSVILILFLLAASYFITYTILEISNTPIPQNDLQENATAAVTAEPIPSSPDAASEPDSTSNPDASGVSDVTGDAVQQDDGASATDPDGDGMDTY